MGSGLRRLWTWWTALGASIGDFQGRAILTLFYFTIAAPFGFVARWLLDPLRHTAPEGSAWIPRPPQAMDLERARKQY